MNDPCERLPELLAIEPPEFLDALVRERTAGVLARSRSSAVAAPVRPPVAPVGLSSLGPRAIAPAERIVYGAGLAVYGGHALYGFVRLLVRTLVG
jgi:hypothetical protein